MSQSKDTAPPRSRKPWRKLWHEESPGFSQLSLAARAVAGYVLKLADDDGNIGSLDKRSPADLIAWRAGATRSDRRMLARALPELLEHGYLALRDGALFVANFARYQDASRAGERRGKSRSGHERATKQEITISNHSTPLPEGEFNLVPTLHAHSSANLSSADIATADDARADERLSDSSEPWKLSGDDIAWVDDFARSCKAEPPVLTLVQTDNVHEEIESDSDYDRSSERFASKPLTPESFAEYFFSRYKATTDNHRPGAFTEAFIDRWYADEGLGEWLEEKFDDFDDDDDARDFVEWEVEYFCELVSRGSERVQSSAFAMFAGHFGSWSNRLAAFVDDGTVSPWAEAAQ